ncbi:hypothetical protein GPECTOR_1g608 [Gonium pectorale]|uniref:Uncharacterized protein n=1 Tax=Gonium pectorale TaxID=33097 RepID=A0A150H3R2_GONPE|nr:hypothetical protein GPECTOR_1g608 [Gonium pectorale]|eukprot:KXZ56675.1 hypothetical protein GPECTOR_1g608 [Gonium pectorale]
MQAALQAAYLFRAGEMLQQDVDEAGEGSWRDPRVRWGLACMAQRYLCGGREGQVSPPGPPGPEWLPAALAERLVVCLSSSCFGDPLLAAHLALALARGANPVVRLQVWNGLAAESALHLLPPLQRCLGPVELYLGQQPPSATGAASAAGGADPGLDPALLGAVQRSLVEGDLERAMLPPPDAVAADPAAEPCTAAPGEGASAAAASGVSPSLCSPNRCSSVAADVALQLLAHTLLHRESWPALERVWRRGPGTGGNGGGAAAGDGAGDRGSGSSAGSGVADGNTGEDGGASAGGEAASAARVVPAAVALLGGLVRSAPAEAVARLVLYGEARCGLRREESAAVLAQTCAGETALRERVRRVLVLCGLV